MIIHLLNWVLSVLVSLENFQDDTDKSEFDVVTAVMFGGHQLTFQEIMKIVFLDFDGVMNFWPKTPQDAIDLGGYCTAKCLEPCRVEILNKFVEETGVKIVVSSSWRRHPDYLDNLPALTEMMREAGIVGEIIGATPSFGHRDEEILEWLSEHPEVTNYVAFDDDRFDMGLLGDHFVHCFHTRGLTPEKAEEGKLALKIPR